MKKDGDVIILSNIVKEINGQRINHVSSLPQIHSMIGGNSYQIRKTSQGHNGEIL